GLTAAAKKDTAAVPHTESYAHLLYAGIDKYALRFVEETSRYSIGLVDNVGKHCSRLRYTLVDFVLSNGGNCQGNAHCNQRELLHVRGPFLMRISTKPIRAADLSR